MINLGPLGSGCIKCGGVPYARNGRAYKLCARCALENIVSLLEVAKKTETESVATERLAFLVGGEEIEDNE